MAYDFTKSCDIYGPIEQARRCLDIWLREEGRLLPQVQKERAAALMARDFYHEDDAPDQLMLSFLRHYSGRFEIDMEDPTSVRMEIKALLDKSSFAPVAVPAPAASFGRHALMAAGVGVVLTILAFFFWALAHKKITTAQQAELKGLVVQIVKLNPALSHSAIWSKIKAPLDVRSYEDISYWDYREARQIVEKELSRLEKRSVGAGVSLVVDGQ